MMSSRYTIVYSPAALDDLKDIYSYIAFHLRAKGTAENLVSRIRSEVKSLNQMPERYALVDWEPWHSESVRTLLVGNYIVYYSVDKSANTVLIGRILYAGRDIEALYQEQAPVG